MPLFRSAQLLMRRPRLQGLERCDGPVRIRRRVHRPVQRTMAAELTGDGAVGTSVCMTGRRPFHKTNQRSNQGMMD